MGLTEHGHINPVSIAEYFDYFQNQTTSVFKTKKINRRTDTLFKPPLHSIFDPFESFCIHEDGEGIPFRV